LLVQFPELLPTRRRPRTLTAMTSHEAPFPLGEPAPAFDLPEVSDGTPMALGDLDAEVVVVVFLCRHCPYVVHVQDELARIATAYQRDGRVAFVGIAANDPEAYPDDAPASLAEQKREVGFPFPYLFDASQEVAKAYGAACTPDPFVLDTDRRLAYRGRIDATRPGGDTPDGADLRAALDALLAGERPDADQWPPMGCSIKWRPGNAPA
jgi:peroxiredoxin